MAAHKHLWMRSRVAKLYICVMSSCGATVRFATIADILPNWRDEADRNRRDLDALWEYERGIRERDARERK